MIEKLTKAKETMRHRFITFSYFTSFWVFFPFPTGGCCPGNNDIQMLGVVHDTIGSVIHHQKEHLTTYSGKTR